MGGSAIGGDLGAGGARRPRHAADHAVRGYALESWTPPDTLVLCASYSGDTEETLACFEAAGAAGAGRVVLTTGGSARRGGARRGRAGDRRARRDAAAGGGALHGSSARSSARAPAAPRRRCTRRSTRPRRCSSGSSRSGDRTPRTTRCRSASPARCAGPLPVDPRRRADRGGRPALEDPAEREREGAPPSGRSCPEANHNEICGWERGDAASRRCRRSSSRTPTSTRASAAAST